MSELTTVAQRAQRKTRKRWMMGQCKYCNQNAGFFRSFHKECQLAHSTAKRELVELVARNGTDLEQVKYTEKEAKKLASSGYIDPIAMRYIMVEGWERVAFKTLAISSDFMATLETLDELAKKLYLPESALEKSKATQEMLRRWKKVHKEKIGAFLSNGMIPPEYLDRTGFPFNLHISETLVWVFIDVSGYVWAVTKPATVDGWGNVRNAQFGWVSRGDGILGITSRHIYFHGGASLRHSYNSILGFDYSDDGVVIRLDPYTNFPPLMFSTEDDAFAFQLLNMLAMMN